MRLRLQFVGCLLALGMSAVLAGPSLGQRPRANFAQNHPPKPPKQQRQQQRQERRQQQQQNAKKNQASQPQQENANRPPQSNPNGNAPANNNPNRPPSATTPPPSRKFNDLSPQEKQRAIDSYRKQQTLPPSQRQELNRRADNWGKLTPGQRDHIRNDLAPKWRQLPPDRKRAIQQRLGVLQNMPESARNQHLNDPNFTRGMSEEDKGMLRDLSHMHVGGPPEPPRE